MEPAVFADDFAGGFRVFVIALHNAGALGQNFAVWCDADQNVGDGLAGTANAIFRIVGGEDRRGFCEAITLINQDADRPEELGEILGKRRAAGEDDAQLPAGSGADFGKDEFVGGGPLQF